MPSVQRVVAEVYMFDTCTHKCGYCWLAESGQVLDARQLDRFRDEGFVDKVAAFFNSRTSADRTWLVQFTGGEPLLAPNLDRLCGALIAAGNRVAFYTSLFIGRRHPSFRFLLDHPYPETDYVMASFHPEAEHDEEQHLEKFALLREAGHRVYLRYIGHPRRLDRLEHFERRCRELDLTFYPTTLLSNEYPTAYTDEERELLASFFVSDSQVIQLAGGIDTTTSRCWAGSRNIAVNLQTGLVTPCITVDRPIIGNLFDDSLQELPGPIRCPQAGISCVCDVHFQQDIVVGAEDSANFEGAAGGWVDRPARAETFRAATARLQQQGVAFYEGTDMGIGDVAASDRLVFTHDEVKERWRNRVAESARGRVSVELSYRRDSIVVAVSSAQRIANVEAFVNRAVGGGTDDDWVQLGTVQVDDTAATCRFPIDASAFAPGLHRAGVNVDLADGARVHWYEQEPRMIALDGTQLVTR